MHGGEREDCGGDGEAAEKADQKSQIHWGWIDERSLQDVGDTVLPTLTAYSVFLKHEGMLLSINIFQFLITK